jgi:hypothetical protein
MNKEYFETSGMSVHDRIRLFGDYKKKLIQISHGTSEEEKLIKEITGTLNNLKGWELAQIIDSSCKLFKELTDLLIRLQKKNKKKTEKDTFKFEFK